jgi:epsilon-lactone hydrolase
MPAFSTRLLSGILRFTGVYRKLFSGGPDFAKYQAKALVGPIAPPAKASAKCTINQSQFAGRDVWEFSPKDRAPEATLLYWHGGGYVYPPADAHWAFFVTMAATYGWRMIVPCYQLAPAADAAATVSFALDLWRDLAGREDAGTITMGGDSAGGGLTAAVAMAARDAGAPLPTKLLLICPWLDVNPSHPDQAKIEPRDAILTLRGLREAGALYAGTAGVADPRVSPIHGNWDGLPPILAFGGGDDILVVDARALKAKLPSVDYREMAGMIHDWPIFTFPESREAQAAMAAFVKG